MSVKTGVIVAILALLPLAGCKLSPDKSLRAKSYGYNYTISWSVSGRDAYFNICSIRYLLLGSDGIRDYSSDNGTTSYSISYDSEFEDYPYIIIYTDDGVLPEKKFLAVYKTSGKVESVSMTLSRIGDSAVFTGVNQAQVNWSWKTSYSEVKFVIRGYCIDGETVLDTRIMNTTELSVLLNTYLKFDITLKIRENNFYLTGGNAQ